MKLKELAKKVMKKSVLTVVTVASMGAIIASTSSSLTKMIQSGLDKKMQAETLAQTQNNVSSKSMNRDIAKVATGEGYAFALKADGTLLAWGANTAGQLGIGSTETVYSPTPVVDIDGNPLTNVVDVYTYANIIGTSTTLGSYGGIALKADGTVWGWGNNTNQATGTGQATNYAAQVLTTEGTPLTNVKMIAAGGGNNIAATNDGEIYTWGYGGNGALGNGGTSNQPTALKIATYENIKQITAGSGNAGVLLEDGTLYMWGYNGWYQLQGTASSIKSPVQCTETNIKKAVFSVENVLLLKEDGTVYVSGSNRYGAIGNGSTNTSGNARRKIAGLENIVDIGCSGNTLYAENANGEIYSWGSNAYYQIMNSSTTNITKPTLIPELTGKVYKLPETSGRYVVGMVYNDGTVYMAGYGTHKLFGYNELNELKTANQPLTKYIGKGNINLKKSLITLKEGQTTDLEVEDNDGTLYLFTKPIRYAEYESDDPAIATVDTTGTVTARGYGSTKIKVTYGEYTLAAIINVVDNSGKDRAKIANGVTFVATLKANGTVWSWGKNTYGQLGDGTKTDSYKPVQAKDVDGQPLTNIKDIAAAGKTSNWNYEEKNTEAVAVLREDGTVWAWGANTLGQLGDGTKTNSLIPVQVIKQDGTPLTNVAKIYAGSGCFYALTEAGEVYGWGQNANNQLGTGNTTNQSKATQIILPGRAIALTTSLARAIAIMGDGTAYGWGLNYYGELGTGDASNKAKPTKLIIDNIKQIGACPWQLFILKEDNSLWGMGYGTYNIGTGSTAEKILQPQRVKGVGGEGYLEGIVKIGRKYTNICNR